MEQKKMTPREYRKLYLIACLKAVGASPEEAKKILLDREELFKEETFPIERVLIAQGPVKGTDKCEKHVVNNAFTFLDKGIMDALRAFDSAIERNKVSEAQDWAYTLVQGLERSKRIESAEGNALNALPDLYRGVGLYILLLAGKDAAAHDGKEELRRKVKLAEMAHFNNPTAENAKAVDTARHIYKRYDKEKWDDPATIVRILKKFGFGHLSEQPTYLAIPYYWDKAKTTLKYRSVKAMFREADSGKIKLAEKANFARLLYEGEAKEEVVGIFQQYYNFFMFDKPQGGYILKVIRKSKEQFLANRDEYIKTHPKNNYLEEYPTEETFKNMEDFLKIPHILDIVQKMLEDRRENRYLNRESGSLLAERNPTAADLGISELEFRAMIENATVFEIEEGRLRYKETYVDDLTEKERTERETEADILSKCKFGAGFLIRSYGFKTLQLLVEELGFVVPESYLKGWLKRNKPAMYKQYLEQRYLFENWAKLTYAQRTGKNLKRLLNSVKDKTPQLQRYLHNVAQWEKDGHWDLNEEATLNYVNFLVNGPTEETQKPACQTHDKAMIAIISDDIGANDGMRMSSDEIAKIIAENEMRTERKRIEDEEAKDFVERFITEHTVVELSAKETITAILQDHFCPKETEQYLIDYYEDMTYGDELSIGNEPWEIFSQYEAFPGDASNMVLRRAQGFIQYLTNESDYEAVKTKSCYQKYKLHGLKSLAGKAIAKHNREVDVYNASLSEYEAFESRFNEAIERIRQDDDLLETLQQLCDNCHNSN